MALLQSGSLFANRFEIDRAAGAGGMGTVYRAVDRYSGEPVALKLLLHRDLKPANLFLPAGDLQRSSSSTLASRAARPLPTR